ncbi:MAG TPA: superoxide dismutase [Steroidobacteraceae bacterium]|nr:superoxide dismutase [Steroidobacteraceae bacterium]
MAIQLPALPYANNALEPHMSARTLEFHHGKHHKTYVDTTNAAIANTELDKAELTTIIKTAHERGDEKLFNNSAQAWNHSFFWNSLTPRQATPSAKITTLLNRDLGGLEGFKKAFKDEAVAHFGSGWTWLVLKGDKLVVASYHDADTPIVHAGVTPLLTCDVWEHAYYLDYQNERPKFLDSYLESLVNWEFAAANLKT